MDRERLKESFGKLVDGCDVDVFNEIRHDVLAISELIDSALAEPSDADVENLLTLLSAFNLGFLTFIPLEERYDTNKFEPLTKEQQDMIYQSLRQHQKPTDAKILAALSWFEDMGNHEIVHRIKQQPDYISTMPDTVIETIVTALLDALRKEPCDLCIDCHNCANNGRLFCYMDCDDIECAKRSGRTAYKHFKAKYKHCPNCGRPLPALWPPIPAPPEGSE